MNWIPWAAGGGLLLLLMGGRAKADARQWYVRVRPDEEAPWLVGGIGKTREEVEAQVATVLAAMPEAAKLEIEYFQAVPDTDVYAIWLQPPGAPAPALLVAHQSLPHAEKAYAGMLEEAQREKELRGSKITMTHERVPRSLLTGVAQ